MIILNPFIFGAAPKPYPSDYIYNLDPDVGVSGSTWSDPVKGVSFSAQSPIAFDSINGKQAVSLSGNFLQRSFSAETVNARHFVAVTRLPAGTSANIYGPVLHCASRGGENYYDNGFSMFRRTTTEGQFAMLTNAGTTMVPQTRTEAISTYCIFSAYCLTGPGGITSHRTQIFRPQSLGLTSNNQNSTLSFLERSGITNEVIGAPYYSGEAGPGNSLLDRWGQPVGEILVYGRQLTTAEVNTIVLYLRTKYNML